LRRLTLLDADPWSRLARAIERRRAIVATVGDNAQKCTILDSPTALALAVRAPMMHDIASRAEEESRGAAARTGFIGRMS
jgi:hypothetical protein